MTTLMKKNKRELVALIQEKEENLGRMTLRNETLESENQRLAADMAGMRADHGGRDAELAALRREVGRLQEENDALQRNISVLQEKNDAAACETRDMTAMREALDRELAEMRRRVETSEARYRAHHDLFRSFVDDDLKKILLLDAAYTIVYVNRAARPVLGIAEGEAIAGRRFFDFMGFKDAVKVKEKIDKAFLEGETEKAKNVKFRCSDGTDREVKLKMSRVRYRDRPSIRIVVK